MSLRASAMKSIIIIYFFAINAISCYDFVFKSNEPAVRTSYGDISGKWMLSTGGRSYASYEGIPYARPPIGELRFKVYPELPCIIDRDMLSEPMVPYFKYEPKSLLENDGFKLYWDHPVLTDRMDPEPAASWSGVLKADAPGSACYQFDDIVTPKISGSEDCLFLNVYVPRTNTSDLPVLVYIHGGAFMYGTSTMFGPQLLMNKDVIVVTINYRLGPLGFLSTGDLEVPGNMGLKDQSMALRWIKNNIAAFRGDPDNVTLTGLSAGGASVHYHLLSDMSKGTFQRAYAHSGSAFAPWAQALNPADKAKKIAAYLNCPIDNSKAMVRCLRGKNATELVHSQTILINWKIKMFTSFVPTVEPADSPNPFITDYPYYLALNGKGHKVPFVTTVTGSEGLYPAALYQRSPDTLDEIENNWVNLAANIFLYEDTLPEQSIEEVADKIKKFYLDGKAVSQDTFTLLVDGMSDRLFIADCGRSAQIHAATTGEPTYVYKYLFRGALSMSEAYSFTKNDYGASHADDSFHIGYYQHMTPVRKDDILMSDILIDMVYSYMTTGVPHINVTSWNQVDPNSNQLDYLLIESPEDMSMASSKDFGNLTFWSALGFKENEQLQSTGVARKSSAITDLANSILIAISFLSVIL